MMINKNKPNFASYTIYIQYYTTILWKIKMIFPFLQFRKVTLLPISSIFELIYFLIYITSLFYMQYVQLFVPNIFLSISP